ncbi:MAG: HAD hydrolase family protein [Clostridia bacterium]|nr:HAD hydrolase family protein [Clostridia bacterium]
MALFSDVLLTADFDRTFTAPDASIPKNNLEAVSAFMENGGVFTVNTGRTVASSGCFADRVPVNAPLLLYNGSAAYDPKTKDFLFAHEIDADWKTVMDRISERFPNALFEYQGAKAHCIFREHPVWHKFCENNGIPWEYAAVDSDSGPFLKFCVYGSLRDVTVDHLFNGTPEEIAVTDEIENWLMGEYGDKCVITRSADLYIDVQPKGVSKGKSARRLKEMLGRKILVCIGDAENDVPMLDDADFAFCPADAAVRDRYTNVCKCSEGSVADLIYNYIPKL